ncbi:hypothetical protein D1157_02965 [Anaerotruncus sp. X29]|nr:hypothetical protein [Anaerotruncus sp. X29]
MKRPFWMVTIYKKEPAWDETTPAFLFFMGYVHGLLIQSTLLVKKRSETLHSRLRWALKIRSFRGTMKPEVPNWL